MKKICLTTVILLIVGYVCASEKQDQQKIQEFQTKHIFKVGKKMSSTCDECRRLILIERFVPRDHEKVNEEKKEESKLTYIEL